MPTMVEASEGFSTRLRLVEMTAHTAIKGDFFASFFGRTKNEEVFAILSFAILLLIMVQVLHLPSQWFSLMFGDEQEKSTTT